jgi:hypothetical protein
MMFLALILCAAESVRRSLWADRHTGPHSVSGTPHAHKSLTEKTFRVPEARFCRRACPELSTKAVDKSVDAGPGAAAAKRNFA